MSAEFKQMTDEQLLAIVNLKTGHYTHDELQAAREEFIRRMYAEPQPLKPEEKEDLPKEIKHEIYDDDIKLSKPVKIVEEEAEELSLKAPVLKNPVFEEEPEMTAVEAELIDEKAEKIDEDIKIAEPLPAKEAFVSNDTDLDATRAFTKAETAVLEHKAEQMGFFVDEEDEPFGIPSNLTEEDYYYYEKQRHFCTTDTKLNKFCRRFVMPAVSVKMFIMLVISLLAVISDFKSVTFNVYACTAFVMITAQLFAWDAVINDIYPIIPKLVLSCEFLLALVNVFSGIHLFPVLLVWIYIALLGVGICGLFPSKINYEYKPKHLK